MSSHSHIFHWGLITCPPSSEAFVRAIDHLSHAKLTAVAIKHTSAEEFLQRYDKKIKHHSSYEDLILDPDIELVYIAVPLHERIPLALACLEYGKGVLCEAPLGLEPDKIQEVFAKAEKKKLPLVECLTPRFLPAIDRCIQLVSDGTLGALRLLQADACIKTPPLEPPLLPEHEPKEAAEASAPQETSDEKKGLWLRHGMYPVFLSVALFGVPQHVSGHVYVDKKTREAQQYALSLRYASGALASLTASSHVDGPCEACLAGTKSRLHIQGPFYGKTILRMYIAAKHTGFVKFNYLEDNLHYPIEHIHTLLHDGRTQSPLWGQKETLAWTKTLARLMDDLPTYTL